MTPVIPLAAALALCVGRVSPITATATPERSAVRLSDPVRVRLLLEGPAPLRVNGEPALDPASARDWRVRPDGPATVSDLPNGHQQWLCVLRADPDRPGNPLRLRFAPMTVLAGADPVPRDVLWPAVTVRVTTSFENPSAADVRPLTGPEDPPPDAGGETWDRATIGLGGIGLLAAVGYIVWRWRPARRGPSPWEVAAAGLARVAADWESGRLPVAELPDALAAAFRAVIVTRFALPADRRTTAELLAAAAWDAPTTAAVGAVLRGCDAARFAGRPPDPAAADALVRRASQLAAGWGRPA